MTNSLEDRLARLRIHLDDAADRRQGTTSGPRDEVLVDLVPRRGQRRSVLVRVLAAMLVVGGLVLALAVALHDSSTPASSSTPGWRRLDRTAAGFERGTSVSAFTTTTDGTIIALGQRSDVNTLTAKAWFSRDGLKWREASVPDANNLGALYGGALLLGRTIVASYTPSPSVTLLSTRNGQRWTKVPATGLDGYQITLAANTRRIVAVGGRGATGAAWTSSDGARWTPADFQDAPPALLSNPVWFDDHFAAVGLTDNTTSTWTSTDGTLWRQSATATPARLGSLYAPSHSRRVYGIQYETAAATLADGGSFGGRLFASRDGSTWTEITSFHDQLPVANPDHILYTHGWWILSGNTGTADGRRRADIWMSRDLQTWSELPRRLQGNAGGGVAVPSGANSTAVIAATSVNDRSLWLWRP
jgi:hypothetical protein